MYEGVEGHQVPEADGGQADEAEVERGTQGPVLGVGEEDGAQEEDDDDEDDADHDGNVDLGQCKDTYKVARWFICCLHGFNSKCILDFYVPF